MAGRGAGWRSRGDRPKRRPAPWSAGLAVTAGGAGSPTGWNRRRLNQMAGHTRRGRHSRRPDRFDSKRARFPGLQRTHRADHGRHRRLPLKSDHRFPGGGHRFGDGRRSRAECDPARGRAGCRPGCRCCRPELPAQPLDQRRTGPRFLPELSGSAWQWSSAEPGEAEMITGIGKPLAAADLLKLGGAGRGHQR